MESETYYTTFPPEKQAVIVYKNNKFMYKYRLGVHKQTKIKYLCTKMKKDMDIYAESGMITKDICLGKEEK
jgi:hypothetical protein